MQVVIFTIFFLSDSSIYWYGTLSQIRAIAQKCISSLTCIQFLSPHLMEYDSGFDVDDYVMMLVGVNLYVGIQLESFISRSVIS